MARNREIRDDQGNLISIQDSEGNTIFQPGDWGTAGYGGSPQVTLNGKNYTRVGSGESYGVGGNFEGQTFQGRPFSDYMINHPTYGRLIEEPAGKAAKALNPTDLGNYLPAALMGVASLGTGLHAAALNQPSLFGALQQGVGLSQPAPAVSAGGGQFGMIEEALGLPQGTLANDPGVMDAWNRAAAQTSGLGGESSVMGWEQTLPGTISDVTAGSASQSPLGYLGSAGGALATSMVPGGLGSAGDSGFNIPGLGPNITPDSVFNPGQLFDLGNMGQYTIDAAGNIVQAGANLANSGGALVPGYGAGGTMQDPTWADKVLGAISGIKSAAGNLWPNLSQSGGGLGGLFGNQSPFDLAARSAPGLLALNYANNQSPFDTSKLESLYNEAGSDPFYNPNLLSYDLQSGQGRNKLTSSLTRRGVMGSSFGNFDLGSYDALRDLGRSSLLGQNLTARTGIANDLLRAQQQEQALKNQLYGRAFDVLGRGLSPGPTLYTAGG